LTFFDPEDVIAYSNFSKLADILCEFSILDSRLHSIPELSDLSSQQFYVHPSFKAMTLSSETKSKVDEKIPLKSPCAIET
jgi:hypothetical protein